VEAIKINTYKFYRSAAWIHKRQEILQRDNYECQLCKAKGRFSRATCVHHIKHLNIYPELGLEESNLISLCDACHNDEHPEKIDKMLVGTKRKFVNEERWE